MAGSSISAPLSGAGLARRRRDRTSRVQASVPRDVPTGAVPPLLEGHLPTGFAALDDALGGGAQTAVTEIVSEQLGLAEWHLLMPALARLSRGNRWLAWVAPQPSMREQFLEYKGFQEAGAPSEHGGQDGAASGEDAAAELDSSRLLMVWPARRSRGDMQDRLDIAERMLRAGNCAAVICWLDQQPQPGHLRRLQQAARQGRSWGLVLHSGAEAEAEGVGSASAISVASDVDCSRVPIQRVRMRRERDGLGVQVLQRRGHERQLTRQMELGLCGA